MNDFSKQGVDWQRFGLSKNPYSTRPLLEGGDVPIDQLFVGRDRERKELEAIFASDESACVAICGNVGVGKTSFANYEKSIWRRGATKPLFSSRTEIEACGDGLSKQKFIQGIIASVLREIELVSPNLVKNDERLKRLHLLVDVVSRIERSLGVSGGFGGFTAGVSTGSASTLSIPPQLSDVSLEHHIDDLMDVIQSVEIGGIQYRGLIVHMNNFDTVSIDEALHFFNEIRDVIQRPSIYFLFLGRSDFYREVIAKEARVKAAFVQTPILMDPLSKSELVQALNARLDAFKAEGVQQAIKPIEDEVVSGLYDLYSGDVRSILAAVSDIIRQGGDTISGPLGIDSALALLAHERLVRIEPKLTPESRKALWHLMERGRPMTQTELATELGKQTPNIVTMLKPLRDIGVLEVADTEGVKKYLDLTPDFACLRYFLKAQKSVQEDAIQAATQLPLGL
ncbi:MAG: hypothetical protein ABIK13_02630 [Patescibacteria group bacterium]